MRERERERERERASVVFRQKSIRRKAFYGDSRAFERNAGTGLMDARRTSVRFGEKMEALG